MIKITFFSFFKCWKYGLMSPYWSSLSQKCLWSLAGLMLVFGLDRFDQGIPLRNEVDHDFYPRRGELFKLRLTGQSCSDHSVAIKLYCFDILQGFRWNRRLGYIFTFMTTLRTCWGDVLVPGICISWGKKIANMPALNWMNAASLLLLS